MNIGIDHGYYRVLNEKAGCIGYLTANLNASAPEFESSWHDRTPRLNTPEFTDDFNDMMDTLRQGILKSSAELRAYCAAHPDSLPLGVCEPKFRKVVEGWEQSRSAGVDPDCMKLTDEQRDLRVFDRIDDISKCHLAYFKDYYESRNTALDKLGGAIFYLDAQLVAFHKSGNEELLRTLKRRGIRIGTKFSVENVGVFAGNTAISRPFVTCYSSGEANYSRLFTDLVCIARYGETSAANGFHAVNLIFIPLEKCNRNAFNSANFVLEAGDFTYKNRILYPHMERRFSLLEQSVQYTADIILLVDDSGDVTFVNSRFENEFGIPVTSIVGKSLRSKLPGLSFVLKALTSGKEIAAGNVQLSFGEEHSRFYYVECLPIREEQNIIGLKVVIKTAEQIRRYSAAAQRHNAVYNFQDIIAESSVMRRVKAAARAAACSPANVLITGESGTGKELFAQAIHNASPRFSGPFIPINCSGFTRDNAGSLLFGTPEKAGKLELADGGTLFLDDISEMSPEMQSFLLRFLDDGLITPANREESIHVDVRIIATAGSELINRVNSGSFRMDLYYRLNVLRLDLPPLRERLDDLEKLSNYFVSILSARYGKNVYSVTPETLELFRGYVWPGNLRELRNIIERSLVNARSGSPLSVSGPLGDSELGVPLTAARGERALDLRSAEEERLVETLIRFNGNKAKAARHLGISRGTVYKRLRELESRDTAS